MAEEALKKLEEQLNCPICLDTYTDPKLLPCHHVYCRKCLVKLVIRDQQGDLVLTCPHCRQVTPVPPRGVAGLQSAFHINHLLEIQESLQKLRVAPVCVEGAVGGECSSLNAVRKASYCSEHSEKELELYCETCGKLICCYCAIKGGRHHSHDHKLLGNAYKTYCKEISLSFEPMKSQLAVINKALAELVTRKWKITDQQVAIEADIHSTMRQLHETLYARETFLVDKLHQMTRVKLKKLAVQKEQLEATQAQLSSCLEFMKESLKTGSKGEVLKMKTTIVKQVKELTTPFKSNSLQPSTDADIVYSTLANFDMKCSIFGQLAPQKVELEVKRMPCQVIEGFTAPWGVVVNHLRQIIVSDIGTDHISIFDSSGQKLRSFGSNGVYTGQFDTPYGIAVDSIGNIFVVDCRNHRVQKFTSEGEYLTLVGGTLAGSYPLQFKSPKDIVFNPSNGKLYVVEDNCRVQILNSDLTFVKSFGSRGSGEGQLDYPCGITCDNYGDIYVADSGNHRIQVFTAQGKFIKEFGRRGNDQGELDLPIGVAVCKGLVYASEYCNHRVSVFTCDGQFVTSFGQEGFRAGDFFCPGSLTVHNDTLYVCGRENPHVQAFSI